jgi:hypothetical protein
MTPRMGNETTEKTLPTQNKKCSNIYVQTEIQTRDPRDLRLLGFWSIPYQDYTMLSL